MDTVSVLKLLKNACILPTCRIAFESCDGAHWLGRLCERHGHEVKLIQPQAGKKSAFILSNTDDQYEPFDRL
jgi:transposase